MSVTDLFWLFFILVSLQPAIRQRLLDMARLRTLRRLEQKQSSRVITPHPPDPAHTGRVGAGGTEQMAYALCCREAPVTVFVPHYAMSGGTLIALAAHDMVMDQNAILGPVDPQLGEYPAVSILRAVTQKDVNEVDDETLILADVAGKALQQVKCR